MGTGVIQPLPGIGDMVWLLPALRAIAAFSSNGRITLFARDSSLASVLFADEPWVERVVSLPAHRRGLLAAPVNILAVRKVLKLAPPGRLFVLHHSRRYVRAAKLAGIKDVAGYKPAVRKLRATGWTRSLEFLRELGIPVSEPHSRVSVSDEKRRVVAGRFEVLPRPWYVFAPGASEPTRCWAAGNFAEVADTVIERTGGSVFLVGAPSEAGTIEALRAASRHGGRLVSLVGEPFSTVMALTAESDALLGNDSGPANVAAALGIPAFVLCGVSRPARHSPLLRLIVPEGEPSMAAITPAQVIGTLLAGP